MSNDLTKHQVLNGRVDYKTNVSSFLEGYEQIVVHPGKNFPYSHLSPYTLSFEGQNVENVYQFSKVYEKVYAQNQWGFVVGHSGKVNVWSHPEEIHVKDGKLSDDFWKWREKGMNNSYAVRYPNGFQGRHSVLYSLYFSEGEYRKLDYVQSRKLIYNRMMRDAVRCSTDVEVTRDILAFGS